MADSSFRDNQKGELLQIPSLDYTNEDELTDGTKLLYENFDKRMDQLEFDASMDVCIFMRDRSGIHCTLEEGHNAEAEDLFDIVLQEQGFPQECEDVFALWLVSPLIELRLKKKHKPFYMVQQWDDLCSKYTDAKAEDISNDEPVLMFQRNVFFPKEQEENISQEQVLNLLFHEAKFNVLEGRYILEPEEYHNLAGIQALLQEGKYNNTTHLLQTYRTMLHQYYPEHMYRKATSPFSFMKRNKEPKEPTEERLLDAHRQISQEMEHVDIEKTRSVLFRRYLEICRPYPFYGAAFFDSHINKPQGKLGFLKRNQNVDTWTAINTNGVCVIDREKDEVILAVPYVELCWEVEDAQFDVDTETFPCLLLQFLHRAVGEDGREQKVTKILRVYSRQARMMNALIATCVERKKQSRQGPPALDEVDGMQGNDFHARCSNKLNKMCLTTYSFQGECLD